MKHPASLRRGAAALLTLVLLLGLTPSARADSPAYGGDVWLQDTPIQDGVVFSDNIFWSDYYSQFRHEYYITYTPGGLDPIGVEEPSGDPAEAEDPTETEETDVPTDPTDPTDPGPSGELEDPEGDEREPDTDMPWWLQNHDDEEDDDEEDGRARSGGASGGVVPVVAFGSSVCDTISASSIAQYYENAGYRVLGIINGDFYDTSTGFPLGMLVSHGRMLSSSSDYYAVGFRADGSVVMGKPSLKVTARADTGAAVLASVNKPRVGGVTMMTYDFRTDHGTGSSVTTPGVNVLASIVEGDAVIGGEMTVQVLEVAEDAEKRTLQPDQVLLTCALDGDGAGLAFLRSLTPGAEVKLTFTTPDPAWNDVQEAIGALYLLVEDGVAQTGFEVSAAPRTAVGVKANGDLVLYTVDGRQTGHSMGASLGVLAQRMAELGCVTALCLDGGGSTTMVSSLPDSTVSKVINSPSDRTLRKVSNHIVLLAPGGSTGDPYTVNLSASAPAVLPGHTVDFTANLADTHFYPMGGTIDYSSSAGEMAGSVLTAPLEPGTVTVTASYMGITAQRDVQVIEAPDGLTIQREGKDISRLDLTPGETVQMGVSALYRHRTLEAWPTDVEWRITPELGTIDENGVLTASLEGGTGYLSALWGDASVTVRVAINTDSPFVDTQGHWAEDFMTRLYYEGILAGSGSGGALYAYPDNGVTRAEFAVLLCRYLGLDPADYAAVEVPFADIEEIDAWARDSVRAMYALGIVNGTEVDGQLVFDPQGVLTRSQAVAMLGRMLALNEDASQTGDADEPAGDGEPDFPDVPDGGSIFIGLETIPPEGWLPEAEPDETEPDEAEPAGEEPGEEEPSQEEDDALGILSQFSDAGEVLPYAREHFRTLVDMGIIQGDNGRLLPNGTMTRAAICKVLATMPK